MFHCHITPDVSVCYDIYCPNDWHKEYKAILCGRWNRFWMVRLWNRLIDHKLFQHLLKTALTSQLWDILFKTGKTHACLNISVINIYYRSPQSVSIKQLLLSYKVIFFFELRMRKSWLFELWCPGHALWRMVILMSFEWIVLLLWQEPLQSYLRDHPCIVTLHKACPERGVFLVWNYAWEKELFLIYGVDMLSGLCCYEDLFV